LGRRTLSNYAQQVRTGFAPELREEIAFNYKLKGYMAGNRCIKKHLKLKVFTDFFAGFWTTGP
jgi:hypothetical protein